MSSCALLEFPNFPSSLLLNDAAQPTWIERMNVYVCDSLHLLSLCWRCPIELWYSDVISLHFVDRCFLLCAACWWNYWKRWG